MRRVDRILSNALGDSSVNNTSDRGEEEDGKYHPFNFKVIFFLLLLLAFK